MALRFFFHLDESDVCQSHLVDVAFDFLRPAFKEEEERPLTIERNMLNYCNTITLHNVLLMFGQEL